MMYKKMIIIGLLVTANILLGIHAHFGQTNHSGLLVLRNTNAQETVANLVTQESNVARACEQELQAIHAQTLAAIKQEFNVDDESWDNYMNTLQELIAQDTLLATPASQPTGKIADFATRAKTIMKQVGINPDRVIINIDTNASKQNTGVACGRQKINAEKKVTHYLDLHIPSFNEFDYDTATAVIRHELMHLKYYDSLEYILIYDLLTKMGNSDHTIDISESMNELCRQREFRADLAGVAGDIKAAKAFRNYFDTLSKSRRQDIMKNWETHPSDIRRFEEISNLVTHLELENSLKENAPITVA